VKKNEIVTIYSVFLLDSLSTTSNISGIEKFKVIALKQIQNLFQADIKNSFE